VFATNLLGELKVDIRKIRSLIELINETGIGEIEIKEGEESVRITRQSHSTVAPAPVATQITVPTPMHPVAMPEPEKKPLTGHVVRSPMVGTLYLANAPEAEPFVQVGQRVNKGDVICVIEAMKMFNQIEADAAGTIKARIVENGTAVEYDEPLFIIEEN
jgi:acetyl-CoA carboxylase biotin carboxyl carrier protein